MRLFLLMVLLPPAAIVGCGSFGSGPEAAAPDGGGTEAGTEAGAELEAAVAADGSASADARPDAATGSSFRIFVTSQTYAGDFGGAAEATNACNSLAAAALVSGKFIALLTATDPDAGTPFDGLGDGRYVGTDGMEIFSKKPSPSASPKAYIADENGAQQSSYVWTGSGAANCLGWTSAAGMGGYGTNHSAFAHSGWLEGGSITCATKLPIYCVEVP
jgi:hypothetical protein